MIHGKGNTMRTSFIKGLTFLLAAGLLCGAAVITTGCQQSDTTEYIIETTAMAIGYDLRNSFDWTPTTDRYYNNIMMGNISLDGAKAAEAYLRTVTHPLIANRFVALAGKVGFTLDPLGHIIGVDGVNIPYAQAAASGFRQGLLLR